MSAPASDAPGSAGTTPPPRSFFASLKNEMYHRHPFTTRARARFAVADYIEVFYNRQRLHSTLGYRTPHEALNDHRTAATAA